MQKNNLISCCAECSAYKTRKGITPYCEKVRRRIDEDSENSVNPALIGFPKWCPLETVSPTKDVNTDYKKEVTKIMQIMEDESNPDPLQEASHLLNSIIQNAKNQAN